MENREAFVRRTLVYLGIVCRVLIMLAPISLFHLSPVPGFRPDQFAILLCLLLPIGCLYITFLARFITGNRYQRPGSSLPNNYVSLSYLLLLILAFAELTVIIGKGLNTTLIDDIWFYFMIALFESAMAIYAGVHLSDLFGKEK